MDRPDVVRLLERANLLPAIFFIFSRVGCDAAVQQVRRSGIRLTSNEERAEIRAIVEERTRTLQDEDLGVLGYWEWLDNLERGIASHHAGLLPAFKEVVEELYQRKLVKVVFATETLALGINMPARTVVLEKMEKFNGEARVAITSGSTPSSPVAQGVAASTSRATPSCSGPRAWIRRRSPHSRPGARIR